MKVCENGHYIGAGGRARAACPCGAPSTNGHKVSLFLPDDLYRIVAEHSNVMHDSLSVQIVTMMRRSLDRKRRK